MQFLAGSVTVFFGGRIGFKGILIINNCISIFPYHPCMVYLPTFGCFLWKNLVNVGKYTIHGWYGICLLNLKETQMLHVWNICLLSAQLHGNCMQTFLAWSMWDRCIFALPG